MSWQDSKNSLADRTRFLWKNTLMSDVSFHLRNNTGDQVAVIFAHKFVLAISSAVFFEMFYGEKAENIDVLELSDSNSRSFEEFLRFLYYDEVHFKDLDSAIDIFLLAVKYNVCSLKASCVAYLEEHLTAGNVLQVLSLAQEHGEEKLVKCCWELVQLQTEEAVKSDWFIKIDKALLLDLLKRDNLNVREIDLFKAVERWGTFQSNRAGNSSSRKCSKRELLGQEVMRLIRFSTMSLEEFAEHVPASNLLQHDEIIRHFVNFSCSKPRLCVAPRSGILHRCLRFSSTRRWFLYSGSAPEFMSFSVDTPVHFFGVRLFGSENSHYTAKLQIYETSATKSEIASVQGGYSCAVQGRQEYFGFDVTLKKPVQLKKDTVYIVEVLLTGPPSSFGSAGKTIVQCDDVTFTFLDDCCPVFAKFRAGQFADILYFKQY